MFRNPLLKAGWRVQLDDAERIAALRRYVSKNKVIPAHFELADKHGGVKHVGVHAIKQAIERGDYDSVVFANKLTPNLLLYMIENELIPYWQGVSAYVYTMTLAQFTDKQKLAAADADVKLQRKLEVIDLYDDANEALSDFGVEYCESLIANFKVFGIRINADKLRDAVLNLSRFEQKLVIVHNPYVAPHEDGRKVYRMFDRVCGLSLFCFGSRNQMILPSTSLINAVLQLVSKQPMQMLPILGTVGDATLNKLHAKDQHPVALYSASIKSNIKSVHGSRSGPIPAYVHDIGHVVWASLLREQERQVLQVHLIPALEYAKLSLEGDDVEELQVLINNLSDYDLTPLKNYQDINQRFEFYINKQLSKSKFIEDADFLVEHILPAFKKANDSLAENKALSVVQPEFKLVIDYLESTIESKQFFDRLMQRK